MSSPPVFIHRGSSPSWGHYFFYSRNLPDHPDSWFKYNDSDVSEVLKDEVLADTTGSTANPYLVSRSVQVRSMPLIEMIHVACICAQSDRQNQTVNRFDPENLVEADP